jgi:hypothetical protein
VQALSEGKTIQIQMNDGWMDVSHDVDLRWDLPSESYRIKPEPREWTVRLDGNGSFQTAFCDPDFPIGKTIRVREILD